MGVLDFRSGELERRLENWARWRSGEGGTGSVSPVYANMPRPPRGEATMPVLVFEAGHTNRCIKQLTDVQQAAIEAEYCGRGGARRPGSSVRERARQAGCCERTYKWRLNFAKKRLMSIIYKTPMRKPVDYIARGMA